MKYLVSHNVISKIQQFYTNVAKKYKHTYDYSLMHKNIDETKNSIYKIENGLLRRKPTITRWANYLMANAGKWYFAYRIEGDIIYVEDVCHSQNMHESRIKHITRNQVIKLTESDLHRMIKESVKQIIYEYKTKRLGKFDVVSGDMTPHKIDGLEQYGKNLYDYRMYSAKDETFCIFKVGKDTRKFICCRLEYDKEYGTWLGFTPIKNYNVPTIIRQDLQN